MIVCFTRRLFVCVHRPSSFAVFFFPPDLFPRWGVELLKRQPSDQRRGTYQAHFFGGAVFHHHDGVLPPPRVASLINTVRFYLYIS